jgi:hypothetical protein
MKAMMHNSMTTNTTGSDGVATMGMKTIYYAGSDAINNDMHGEMSGHDGIEGR